MDWTITIFSLTFLDDQINKKIEKIWERKGSIIGIVRSKHADIPKDLIHWYFQKYPNT